MAQWQRPATLTHAAVPSQATVLGSGLAPLINTPLVAFHLTSDAHWKRLMTPVLGALSQQPSPWPEGAMATWPDFFQDWQSQHGLEVMVAQTPPAPSGRVRNRF